MPIEANGTKFSNGKIAIVAMDGGIVNADNSTISGFDIGVMADKESLVTVNNADSSNCDIHILGIGDIQSFLKILKDNNVEIKEFKKMLDKLVEAPNENKIDVIKKYGFYDYLEKIQAIDFVIQKVQLILEQF